MPYRSDGVARALQATYGIDTSHVPDEMVELLTAIDAARMTSGRGSKP